MEYYTDRRKQGWHFLWGMIMIDGYVTIQEIAERWGITSRRVQVLCVSGKIKGPTKFGRVWAIPVDANRPEDGRVTTGKYRNWRNYKKDMHHKEPFLPIYDTGDAKK